MPLLKARQAGQGRLGQLPTGEDQKGGLIHLLVSKPSSSSVKGLRSFSLGECGGTWLTDLQVGIGEERFKGKDEVSWLCSVTSVSAPSILVALAETAIVSESAIVEFKCPGFGQILEAWDPGWMAYGHSSRTDDSGLQTFREAEYACPPSFGFLNPTKTNQR